MTYQYHGSMLLTMYACNISISFISVNTLFFPILARRFKWQGNRTEFLYHVFYINMNINEFYFICLMILSRVKLDRALMFIKYIISAIPLIFPPKTSIWKENGVVCIVLAESSRAGEKWGRGDLLRKYLTILFSTSISRLNISLLEDNN